MSVKDLEVIGGSWHFGDTRLCFGVQLSSVGGHNAAGNFSRLKTF